MLVIHPKDKTTAMLSALYDGQVAQVVDDYRSAKEMAHLLYHVSTQERIMLLGHSHAYHLCRHGSNIVAVWCNAGQFARAEGLHGLFTGMIVSEVTILR